MASYVERNLRPSEELVAQARVSWAAIIPVIIVDILLIIVLFVANSLVRNDTTLGQFDMEFLSASMTVYVVIICIISLVINLVRITSVELGVSDKKIIGKSGIVVRNSLDAYLEKIDNFSVTESFWGNVFGYATIQITTVSARLRFPYIKDAVAFKNVVMDCYEAREQKKLVDQARFIALATGTSENAFNNAVSAISQRSQTRPQSPFQDYDRPVQAGKVCSKCGFSNSLSAAFCEKCGGRLV
ncbi:MAG: PH domain-containing protein [Ruminococcus sp.]|nr:PH domain-containing protein [Ruminococcus sp.]